MSLYNNIIIVNAMIKWEKNTTEDNSSIHNQELPNTFAIITPEQQYQVYHMYQSIIIKIIEFEIFTRYH